MIQLSYVTRVAPTADPPGLSATGRDAPALPFTAFAGRFDSMMLAVFLACTLCFWMLNPEAFISDDSYFYLVIARNWVAQGQCTFSGIMETNGVHPLWLWMLTGYTWLIHAMQPAWLANGVYAVPLSFALLLWTTRNLLGIAGVMQWRPLLTAIVPVAYLSFFGVLYSEAHLHAATLTWLMARLVGPTAGNRLNVVWTGIAIAAVFLSRLDAVFMLAALALWAAFMLGRRGSTLVAALLAACMVMPYLLYNLVQFDAMMPVSGWMKSTFPEIFFKGSAWKGLRSHIGGYSVAFGVLPIGAGILSIAICRRSMRPAEHLLTAVTAGVVCHFLYIALFTRSHTLWYWYFVQPVVLAGLVSGFVVARLKPSRVVDRAGGAVVMAATVAAMVMGRTSPPFDETHWLAKALKFTAQHELHGTTIITSDYPGYLAFRTDNQIIALDLLTANRRFYNEMLQSDNALRFILHRSSAAGHSAAYVFHLGSEWLTISDDGHEIAYNDPRSRPVRPIGRLSARDGLELVHRDGGFLVWRLRPSSPRG